MSNRSLFSIGALCTILLFSCKGKEKEADNPYANFLQDYMDTTVRPGDDFFKYAMGNWLKNNPIPESESSWGIWSLVNEENYKRLRQVNEEAAANVDAKKGSVEQKIGDFWFTGMDSVGIDKMGITPLQSELDKIHAIKDLRGVAQEAAYLQSIGVNAMFDGYIFQDEKNSELVRMHFYQGGLGLPERDYYFDNDDRTKNIRAEYMQHVTKMFTLMGYNAADAGHNASTIMGMEMSLAAASRKLEDLRDPYLNYNKMSVAELQKACNSIQWDDFFTVMGAGGIDTVIVGQPEFFAQLDKSLKGESIDNWKVYLEWNLINGYAPYLSSDFDQEHFHFYSTVLNGVTEQKPRWKRVLRSEENAMGFLLGQIYVQKYYPPEEKERYTKIVENVMTAYAGHIKNLDWMSDSTKTKALEKLSTVVKKVGYPDHWRDYSALEIERDAYVLNVIRANKFAVAYEIQKLFKPVDRTEWDMTPQTWNAYYNPSNNEIVLPAAAFIVPGVPDKYVDDAIAYGYAAGSTIGHEITHGFDDQGSQYDAKGNLVDWWTESDKEKFNEKTQQIVDQFNGYIVIDSIHVNGEATQGENIADLGGMLLGLEAYKMTDEYKAGKTIGGLTPTQRYFLGFALSWYGHIRPEALAVRAKTDVHAPNFLRVNGPVTNIDDWYSAFNVQPGDSLFVPKDKRITIW
ncbi:MAG: M13 family metallopeptidase [Chitinophagales bacterium]